MMSQFTCTSSRKRKALWNTNNDSSNRVRRLDEKGPCISNDATNTDTENRPFRHLLTKVNKMNFISPDLHCTCSLVVYPTMNPKDWIECNGSCHIHFHTKCIKHWFHQDGYLVALYGNNETKIYLRGECNPQNGHCFYCRSCWEAKRNDNQMVVKKT